MEQSTPTEMQHSREKKISETTSTALAKVCNESENKIVESSKTLPVAMIAELRPTSYGKAIEVRVCRKWISTSYAKKTEGVFSPKKKETAFCCILVDQEVHQNSCNLNKTH
jgi:hypothetical protein